MRPKFNNPIPVACERTVVIGATSALRGNNVPYFGKTAVPCSPSFRWGAVYHDLGNLNFTLYDKSMEDIYKQTSVVAKAVAAA